MTNDKTAVVTTERRIGKVTYTIYASASQQATETLDRKIRNPKRPAKTRRTSNIFSLTPMNR